ncbi:MAG: N-acetylglucosamine-6-phosphate deacetylase [Rhodobacteraceae bacterium]|nr:MAG: N-acetylglucosamine-6-phosphate deacetylase [Paracoccaceae bacterium]
MTHVLKAAQIFDGWRLLPGGAVSLTKDGRIGAVYPEPRDLPADAVVVDLGAGILAPGLVDLQVNGGGAEMIGAQSDADQIARICAVQARLGATAILPTLITDTPEVTRQVIDAAITADARGCPGLAGLHLEGPHLDPARKGAHDGALIRPMTAEDQAMLCDAAQMLPALMLTVAPESVTLAQIAALAGAGVIVSLGHTGCSTEAARAAQAAGARCVTHLYNAMPPLQNRAPGLVGHALSSDICAGIIADGVHVAPEPLQIALAMKGPDRLFLVSDCMAVAGTDQPEFTLNGRRILRRNGRLELPDGTLAGADISLVQSLARLVGAGVDPARALAMATRIPADLIGASGRGRIVPGCVADLVVLDDAYQLQRVYLAGVAQ